MSNAHENVTKQIHNVQERIRQMRTKMINLQQLGSDDMETTDTIYEATDQTPDIIAVKHDLGADELEFELVIDDELPADFLAPEPAQHTPLITHEEGMEIFMEEKRRTLTLVEFCRLGAPAPVPLGTEPLPVSYDWNPVR